MIIFSLEKLFRPRNFSNLEFRRISETCQSKLSWEPNLPPEADVETILCLLSRQRDLRLRAEKEAEAA